MRKKLTLLLLFSCCGLIAWPTGIPSKFIVWAIDGSSMVHLVDEMPIISFDDKNMIITSTNTQISYSLDNVLRISYEDLGTTHVETNFLEKDNFLYDNETLSFEELPKGSNVMITTLDGKAVANFEVEEDGTFVMPMTELSTGVYIVTVNGSSYKILKR